MLSDKTQLSPEFILPAGTLVVTRVEVQGVIGKAMHPRGAVGVVVHAPADVSHSYRVRFPDGFEAPLLRSEFVLFSQYKQGVLDEPGAELREHNLFHRVILRVIVGSRAFGLDGPDSDTDRRGVYLPPAELHWSLFGVPEQLENDATQECYWELQKFLTLALKANPNVIECLYSPLVEEATPIGQELLSLRGCFLSRMIYQTFNGYAASQFKKIQADLRNQGQVKWKHVMHLLRLVLSGTRILREGIVEVRVEEHRDRLLAIRDGATPMEEIEAWRLQLHAEFDQAFATTSLPERPDYERVNAFLISARRRAANE